MACVLWFDATHCDIAPQPARRKALFPCRVLVGIQNGRNHTANAPIDEPIKNTGAPGHFALQNGTRTASKCCEASATTSVKLRMAKRGSFGSESPWPCTSKVTVAILLDAKNSKTAYRTLMCHYSNRICRATNRKAVAYSKSSEIR